MTPTHESSHIRHEQITVAQCLLKYLKLEDATKIFGVPGGAIKYLLDELSRQRDGFEYVICRQETGAAYMADGYARVTGKLGVVLVTSGPGATNALTGAVNAQCSNSSVLVISGEVPEDDYGKGYLQEGVDAGLDVNAVYRGACQYTALISSPRDFQTLFAQAIRGAMARPRRTTHISLPEDVSNQLILDAAVPNHSSNYRATASCSDPEKAKQTLEYLLQAKRPLLFLGAGCREALVEEQRRKNLETFVDKLALPVMTSPGAKGLFSETNDFSLRTYGLAGCEWPQYYLSPYLLDRDLPCRYDCLVVLACSLGDLATHMWHEALTPHGPFVQVDLDQGVLGRAFPIDLGIVAEIGHFIDDLMKLGEQAAVPDSADARRKLVKRIRDTPAYRDPDKRDSIANPILPQALMKCLSEKLKELSCASHVFIDAGNCVGWALHYLEIDPPAQVHSALAMGPMGFGVGSVVGAKLGAPESVCVGIVGDGAFLMHGSEVSTAARYGVGAIWIVLFDDDLAMVSQGMDFYFPGERHSYSIGKPQLKQFAEALGATAYPVDSAADFLDAFSKAVEGTKGDKPKPQVIIVGHNTNEIPPYYPVRKG